MNKGAILVIGGNGTIGTKLVKFLQEEEHEVYVIDPQNFNNLESNIFLGYGTANLSRLIPEYNIKTMIHLGEMLSIDNLISPQYIFENNYLFADVLHTCIKNNVDCKCVIWDTLYVTGESDLLTYSLKEKRNIIDVYNKMQFASISTIACPNVIDFDYPASNYFGVWNRILNGYLYNNSIYMKECEYRKGVCRKWSDTQTVINSICKNLFVRNKHTFYPKSYSYDLEEVFGIFMDILGIEKMEIACEKNMLQFNRKNFMNGTYFKDIFESEIDRMNAQLKQANEEITKLKITFGTVDGGRRYSQR